MAFPVIAAAAAKALPLLKTVGTKVAGSKAFGTLNNALSTGNKAKDLFGGFLAGVDSANQRPGMFFGQYNWAGDGLAKNDIGYMRNPSYDNPYDKANAISSVWHNGQTSGNKNPLSRLGGLFSRNRNKQAGGFEPVNTMSDYIGNAVNGSPLRTEGIMGNLQEQTNYGGYIPQFLPSSFEERGGFDNSMM